MLLQTPALVTQDLVSLSGIIKLSLALPICSKDIHKRENVLRASALRNVPPTSLDVKSGKTRKMNRSCRRLKDRKG